MTEDEKMYCFITGLQAEVKLQVKLQRPSDLQTAKEIGDRADTIIFQAKRFSRGRSGPSSDTSSGNWSSQDDEAMKLGATRLTDSEGEKYMKEGKCFRCGKMGHRANQHNADGSPQKTRLPWPFNTRVRNELSRENKNRTEKRQKETYLRIAF
jgi:Zinc knuckle